MLMAVRLQVKLLAVLICSAVDYVLKVVRVRV